MNPMIDQKKTAPHLIDPNLPISIQNTFLKYDDLNPSEKALHDELKEFYSNNNYIEDILQPLNTENHRLSLRLINWVVTNYVRVQGVRYAVNDIMVDIHANYQSQLNHWKKNLFDPFRRNRRFLWPLSDGEYMITTLSQLNFFRWCIQYHVLNFILAHQQEMEAEMKKHEKKTICKSNWACTYHIPISISVISNT